MARRSLFQNKLLEFDPDTETAAATNAATSAATLWPESPDDRFLGVFFDHFPKPVASNFDRVEAGFAIDFVIEDRWKEGSETASDASRRRSPSAPVAKRATGDSAKKRSGAGIVTCPVCNSSFTTQGNLNRHCRTKHEGKKVLCDVGGCDQSFSQMSDLRRHKNRIHPELMDMST